MTHRATTARLTAAPALPVALRVGAPVALVPVLVALVVVVLLITPFTGAGST